MSPPRHSPPLALIAVVARNGVIGDGSAMPWHLPEDARYFRDATAGCPVVMGRRTWDSLPPRFRPLPGRSNLVVSRQPGWSADGAQVCTGLDEALALAGTLARRDGARRVFVIGGAELYAQALPFADELVLTEIDADFAGGTRFPDWDRAPFVEARREHRHSPSFDFDFVTYQRKT